MLVVLLLGAGAAHAGRRIVVLEFDGPKADRFHQDVEDAIRKGKHTIVDVDDWNAKAEDLGATKVNARNIQKVARKLKVDGVVVGDVEKRGQRYYVHLRLREGVSGEYVAEVEIVVRQGKLGSDGAQTVKDELLPAIRELEKVSEGRGDGADEGDDDEDEDRPKKSKKKKGFDRGTAMDDDEDEDDDEADRGGDDDDDDEADDDEDEDRPAKKSKKEKKAEKAAKEKAAKEKAAKEKAAKEKAAKEKAAREKAKKDKKKRIAEEDEDEDDDDEARGDDDEDDDEDRGDDEDDDEEEVRLDRGRGDDDGDDEDVMVDPRLRALDIGGGLSVSARRLAFDPQAGQADTQGYKGKPVAGAMIAADLYPLAFNKKNKSITRNIGISVLFDRVVKIESRLQYDEGGTQMTAVLGTVQQHYAVGLLYRHLIGAKMAVIGSIRYNRMAFTIDKDAAPAGVTVQIPNVDYASVDPGVAIRYLLNPKTIVGGGLSVGAVLGTGEMQTDIGAASVLPIGVDGGVAYYVTPKIVVRGDLHIATYGLSFKDSTTVKSGRDSWFGGAATAAYQF